jgi:hypothetical protein
MTEQREQVANPDDIDAGQSDSIQLDHMDEEEFVAFLAKTIGAAVRQAGCSGDVRSFEEAGVVTYNAGLTVRVGGAEFQITVVQNR